MIYHYDFYGHSFRLQPQAKLFPKSCDKRRTIRIDLRQRSPAPPGLSPTGKCFRCVGQINVVSAFQPSLVWSELAIPGGNCQYKHVRVTLFPMDLEFESFRKKGWQHPLHSAAVAGPGAFAVISNRSPSTGLSMRTSSNG